MLTKTFIHLIIAWSALFWSILLKLSPIGITQFSCNMQCSFRCRSRKIETNRFCSTHYYNIFCTVSTILLKTWKRGNILFTYIFSGARLVNVSLEKQVWVFSFKTCLFSVVEITKNNLLLLFLKFTYNDHAGRFETTNYFNTLTVV